MMAKIATCPKCAAQLGLPDSATLTDRVACPECQADFLLAETIQIALPVARVLAPTEALATAARPEPSKSADPPPAAPKSSTAPKSWETRLKKAIATDATDPEEPVTQSPPSFEFELDLKTPAEAEEPSTAKRELDLPKSLSQNPPGGVQRSGSFEQSDGFEACSKEIPSSAHKVKTVKSKPADEPNIASKKTLADFAAIAASKTIEMEMPAVVSPALERPVKKIAAVVEPTPTDFSPAEVDRPQRVLPAPLHRRVVKRGFPKVAAFVVGPVLGGILGLSGLLWLRGTPLAEVRLPVEENSMSMAARELMKPQAPLKRPVKLDDAVQPATAYQPLATHTTLNEFNALVDAAGEALPQILSGDLSEPELVRRKGQAYMALCRLAEHFDFARQPGLAPPVLAKIQQAEQLYRQLSNDAGVRQQLSHIASRWWEYEQRPSQGIFLTGQIQKTQIQQMKPAGTATLCWVRLTESQVVPVLLKHSRYQTGDSIGVVGKVVGSPSKSLANFGVDLAKIVEAEYSYGWNPEQ